MLELRQKPNTCGIYPDEISEKLLSLAGIDATGEVFEELENAVYYLRTCAENGCNNDYFRIFYNVLCRISEN